MNTLRIKTLKMRINLRKNKALALAEVAAGAVLTTIFLLLVIDAVVLIYASFMNDTACRDAARAASKTASTQQASTTAQQSANSALAALQAANSSLYAHQISNPFVSNPTLYPSNTINYQDFQQGTTTPTSPPGFVPYVTVTTMVNVKLPMPVVFFGQTMLQGGSNNTMTFYRSYTFPIAHLSPTNNSSDNGQDN